MPPLVVPFAMLPHCGEARSARCACIARTTALQAPKICTLHPVAYFSRSSKRSKISFLSFYTFQQKKASRLRVGCETCRSFSDTSALLMSAKSGLSTRSNRKDRPSSLSFLFHMVEVMGVEPMSESISTGISPSAVNDLVFRIGGRPLTGCRLRYLVVPC